MKYLLVAFVLLLATALPLGPRGSVFALEESLKITEIVITSKIAEGKPIDSIKRLSSGTEKNLYCFTRLVAPEGFDSHIQHIWYKGDEKVAEYKLPVRGQKWRTYSKKNIRKGWSGDWRVEVVDAAGTVLKTVKFRMN